ncbi:MAG: hypothetical protein WC740_07665 [Verrucomicrobiia bacterium]
MTDTPANVERMVREKLMSRSGEERFVMGALMFDAAREMILASFPPGLTEPELKRRLCERLYGADSVASKLFREHLST